MSSSGQSPAPLLLLGFESGAVPSSALIRTARGQLRKVSFEVGWDVYNGRRPGTLVAVCLERARARSCR